MRVVRKAVTIRGEGHVFTVVEHPGSVVVVPRQGERFGLIRQRRPVVEAWLWEFPAGTLDPGEEPTAAARRELAEETGFVAGVLEPLGSFYLCPGYSTEEVRVFLAPDPAPGGPARLDAGEEIEPVHWFSREELRALIRSGQLQDAKSLAAALRVLDP